MPVLLYNLLILLQILFIKGKTVKFSQILKNIYLFLLCLNLFIGITILYSFSGLSIIGPVKYIIWYLVDNLIPEFIVDYFSNIINNLIEWFP